MALALAAVAIASPAADPDLAKRTHITDTVHATVLLLVGQWPVDPALRAAGPSTPAGSSVAAQRLQTAFEIYASST
ncbi:hypothetical protein BJY04DRAFT_219361 [Aspergillus karnatakaensis]|uniref:uncharacterized protein n=1 Tax=Aspergillus karnatakaensis TaxID=1810916 RepID=UPI003CCD45BE